MINKEKNICQLPKESGPCRGFFQRFHFNKQSGKCEEFVYGYKTFIKSWNYMLLK